MLARERRCHEWMAMVAVVERSRTQRMLLRKLVEEAGHETLEATSAAEAKALMRERRLDAVLLAWELDDAPAPTLLREWQSDPSARSVPVLMVTSHTEPERVYQALSLGAVDFLRKPVDQVELVARLGSALRTRQLELELHHQATRDPLTGLLNRREFTQKADAELKRSTRYSRPATICILDLDHFKSVNDTFGHDAGDQVLQQMADLLRSSLRGVDLVGRHGGEEFTVLLPETPAELGVIGMRRVLDAVRGTTWLKGQRKVTFSCGVTDLAGRGSVQEALAVADAGLYRAKELGRDRVVKQDER